MNKQTDNRPYYVAFGKRFSYVRGLDNAYRKMADYIDGTVEEIRLRRKHHNCPGMIKRVNAVEARAAGI